MNSQQMQMFRSVEAVRTIGTPSRDRECGMRTTAQDDIDASRRRGSSRYHSE